MITDWRVAFDRDGSHVGTLMRVSQVLGELRAGWVCSSSGQADPPGVIRYLGRGDCGKMKK